MLRSHRLALVAAVLVLGLSACGDTPSSIDAGKSPVVVHVGASQNSGKGLPTTATADGAMRPYLDVTYVFDGQFPDLGATAASWTLPAGVKPDPARIAAMAKALGADGEVRVLPADQGGGWAVGPNDGSAPSLVVSNDGLLSWWFNGTAATIGVGCSSAGSAGSGGASTDAGPAPDQPPVTTIPAPVPDPCQPPPAPPNVPDKASAEAKAKALMAQLGMDVAAYALTTYADPYSASVSGQLLVGGTQSQLTFNVGFGAEGAVTYASGALSTPQVGAQYPLVSGEVALQRLNDHSGKWQYFGSPQVRVLGGVAADIAARPAANSPSTAVGSANTPAADAPTPLPTCPPLSPDGTIPECTVPASQPVTVHLDAARLDLTMVWAQDGTVWLLPAYTFTSADGGQYTVVAVEEQYLDIPQPTVDTAPTDTVPPDTVPVVTPPVPQPTTPPAPPVTDVPGTAAPIDQAVAEKALVGLTLDEATKVATGNGWELRVSTLDGVAQILTDDLRTDRVNVAVKGGIVVAVDSIG